MRTILVALLILQLSLPLRAETTSSHNSGYDTHGMTSAALTDAEQNTATNYVNDEYINKAVDTECQKYKSELQGERSNKAFDKETFNPCSESDTSVNEIGSVFGGTADSIIDKMAPIAYTMIIGSSTKVYDKKAISKSMDQYKAKNPNASPEELKTEEAKAKKENTKDGEDFCKYIPTATEMVSQATQQIKSNEVTQAPVLPEERQYAAFKKIARLHEVRRTVANFQVVGWAATAVCYVGYSIGPAVVDWKMYVKIAGATLLASYYGIRASRHKKAAEWFNTKANDFAADKVKGLCNPVTQKDCYCGLESKKNESLCQPKQWQARANTGIIVTSCVDSNMQTDANCACAATSTCYDQSYVRVASAGGFGSTSYGNAMASMSSAYSGAYNEGALLANANASLNAARRYLAEQAQKGEIPAPIGKQLSPAQAQVAQELVNQGLPRVVAAQMASLPSPSNAADIAKKLGGGSLSTRDMLSSARSNPGEESGSSYGSAGRKNSKGKGEDDMANPFARFGQKPEAKPANQAQILTFAEKAVRGAQIENNSSRPIFDIISNRYRQSGWKQLNVMDNLPK